MERDNNKKPNNLQNQPKKQREEQHEQQEKEYNEKIINAYDYMSNAASARDCTGLIPFEPTSDAERESYEDLYEYQYLPPKFPPKGSPL